MRSPVQHEQAYTPPPQEDTNTIAESASESEAMDIGEQTTSQAQPATTGAR
ncbi:hypothetical protein [Actinomyces sp. 565]|uniref:hypothetical protein n=1 Tax=Actinomyces sp. 565 TaxID=2057794 RepID=UPI001EEFC587|nr:hypothetical protein [Actinomyces sp. 565]